MADDLALDQVDDVLGDVGGVVGDPFQVADGAEQGQARLDVRRRPPHRPDDLGDDVGVEAVDLVVQADDPAGPRHVQVDEGVQALADHGRCQVGHPLEGVGDGDVRRVGQGLGPLGDVHGQVGHAFEVHVDGQDGGDAAEVDGHRLVQGQNLQTFFLDPVLRLVDGVVPGDDLAGQIGVPVLEGADGLVDGLLDRGSHPEDIAL